MNHSRRFCWAEASPFKAKPAIMARLFRRCQTRLVGQTQIMSRQLRETRRPGGRCRSPAPGWRRPPAPSSPPAGRPETAGASAGPARLPRFGRTRGGRQSAPWPRVRPPPSCTSAPGKAAPRRLAAIGMQPRGIADAGALRPGHAVAADQQQVGGHSRLVALPAGAFEALLQHIFGHGAVGGPFAAGHRDQAAAADQHGVLAAQALGVVAVVVRRLDQRPQADPDASDVGAASAPGSDSGPTSRRMNSSFFLERLGLARPGHGAACRWCPG